MHPLDIQEKERRNQEKIIAKNREIVIKNSQIWQLQSEVEVKESQLQQVQDGIKVR